MKGVEGMSGILIAFFGRFLVGFEGLTTNFGFGFEKAFGPAEGGGFAGVVAF